MNRLKELRIEHNLTQSQLAEAVKTSQRNISRWEKNEIEMGLNFAVTLACYFNVSIDYLAGIEDDFGVRIATPITAPDISTEELQLINDYRTLSPGLKDMIKRTMDIYTSRIIVEPKKKTTQ